MQYTGRENDSTGLYYYRARYYDPQLKRFISEDPIGLGGGVNQYGYVGGNPIRWTDPLGLWSITVEFYDGLGGGIVFGRDPNTGGGFLSLRGGVGIGGGASWDPNGGRPGGEGGSSCHGGVGAGVFGEVGGNIGPVQAGINANAGVNFNSGTSNQGYAGIGPSGSLGTSWGIQAGAAAGGEVTIFDTRH